jgi:hypothetical protein
MRPQTRPIIPTALASLTGTVSAIAGVPWEITITVVIFTLVVSLAVVVLESVFPQESADRLAWWRDHRRHRRLRKNTRTQTPPHR